MSDESLFMPIPPSPEVAEYIKVNSEFDLHSALSFLVQAFPPHKSGQLDWLIDGGGAVNLLTDANRPVADIDLITREKTLADKFANSGQFDAKDITFWLKYHNFPESVEMVDRVFDTAHEIDLDGSKLWVLQPELLAVSKQLPYANRPARPKDLADIAALGVAQQQIDKVIAELQTLSAHN